MTTTTILTAAPMESSRVLVTSSGFSNAGVKRVQGTRRTWQMRHLFAKGTSAVMSKWTRKMGLFQYARDCAFVAAEATTMMHML
jgi:hypothetical protein